MSRGNQTTNGDPAVAAEQVRQPLTGKHVCPYCGHQYPGGPEPCPRCTMEDTPATRQATKARIGPWYVLQSRNPAAPGMKFATLLALINRGQVTPRSIIRGPSTSQLWRFAAHARGVSREFGLCYSCGGSIDKTSSLCPHCQRSQEPPADPDVLLEPRTNGQAMPERVETSTYTSRMQDFNRQQAQAANGTPPVAARPRQDAPRRPDGRIVSAMELAAALQDDPSRALKAPRRRVALKSAALLLFLAALVGAALLYFMPEYRQPTFTWANQTWQSITTKVASIDWPKWSWSSHSSPATATPPKVIEPAIAEPPPAPVAVHRPAPEPVRPVPAPAPVEAVSPPAPEPAPPVDATAAIDQARKLWVQAIDAEARQDFPAAVRLYEQIKKLPNQAWPQGLQLNLDLARKRSESSKAE